MFFSPNIIYIPTREKAPTFTPNKLEGIDKLIVIDEVL
jgi:hypothetical protein